MAVAISQEIQTGDMPLAGFFTRATLYRVWVWFRNPQQATSSFNVTFTISTSTDGGTTWTAAPSVIVSDGSATKPQHLKFDIIENAYLIRVKVAWSTWTDSLQGTQFGGMTPIEGITLEYEDVNNEE